MVKLSQKKVGHFQNIRQKVIPYRLSYGATRAEIKAYLDGVASGWIWSGGCSLETWQDAKILDRWASRYWG